MDAVRFIVEGFINSFRIPQTSVYQLTYLAPTKTQIAGMLTNIMGKNEKNYYDILRKIKIGILPLNINSIFTDAWTFRKWKHAGSGRDILNREKLYKSNYLIYISAENSLLDELLHFLKNPARIPSLGMDDEMIIIKDVEKITLEQKEDTVVHSVFRFEENMEFIPKFAKIERNMEIFPPRIVTINRDFDENKIPRKPKEFIQVVEFSGAYCEINVPKTFCLDQEKNYNIELI